MSQKIRTRAALLTLSIALMLSPSLPRAASDPPATTTPLLQPELDSMKARFMDRAPKEKIDLYQSAIDDLEATGILTRALNVNDTVPDFTLPDAAGRSVRLSQLLAKSPVVLSWYRGGWCPYCNVTLRAWMRALPEVRKAGGQLVAISPEVPDSSLSTKERLTLEFEVLSDSGNGVARQFGIAYKLPEPIISAYSNFFSLSAYNGTTDNELPLAATYIIDSDRVIRYAFLDADYKARAEPSDVIRELRAILKK